MLLDELIAACTGRRPPNRLLVRIAAQVYRLAAHRPFRPVRGRLDLVTVQLEATIAGEGDEVVDLRPQSVVILDDRN